VCVFLLPQLTIADNTKGLPKIQPLFITVDPVRDSPAILKEYLKGETHFQIHNFFNVSKKTTTTSHDRL